MAKLGLSVHMGATPHPETAVCYCEWGCALPPVAVLQKSLSQHCSKEEGRKGLFRVSQNEVTPIAAVRSSLGLLGAPSFLVAGSHSERLQLPAGSAHPPPPRKPAAWGVGKAL